MCWTTIKCNQDNDLQGQPQWRKNVMTVDLPFGSGSCSSEVVGASEPTTGIGDILIVVGVFQLFSSCCVQFKISQCLFGYLAMLTPVRHVYCEILWTKSYLPGKS